MADLSAMTSGLESNAIGTGAGGGTPVWSGCECVRLGRPPAPGAGAAPESCAEASVGVRGETGGLLGEGGLSLGRLSVEIVKAGMIEVRGERGQAGRTDVCTGLRVGGGEVGRARKEVTTAAAVGEEPERERRAGRDDGNKQGREGQEERQGKKRECCTRLEDTWDVCDMSQASRQPPRSGSFGGVGRLADGSRRRLEGPSATLGHRGSLFTGSGSGRV